MEEQEAGEEVEELRRVSRNGSMLLSLSPAQKNNPTRNISTSINHQILHLRCINKI